MEKDIASLFHPRNIHFGEARLIYSTEPAGWVIPGGSRTTDEAFALCVAKNIDRLIRENMHPLEVLSGSSCVD